MLASTKGSPLGPVWWAPHIGAHSDTQPTTFEEQEIVVMSIRFASVLIAAMCFTACGAYSPPDAPSIGPTPAPVGSTTVTISNGASTQTTTAFGQNPLTISVGTTISWLNDDNTTHTSAADGSQWSSGNIAPGGRFNFAFASAGRFTYHCQIHPNMVGTIVVQ
jgi:plastocyanin